MITSNVKEHIHFKNKFLKNDADILQKFLEAEGKPELHRVLCDTCQRYKAWLAKFWENTKLIDIHGKKRIMVIVPYKNPVAKKLSCIRKQLLPSCGRCEGNCEEITQ